MSLKQKYYLYYFGGILLIFILLILSYYVWPPGAMVVILVFLILGAKAMDIRCPRCEKPVSAEKIFGVWVHTFGVGDNCTNCDFPLNIDEKEIPSKLEELGREGDFEKF
jgi:hypothetical protein